MQNEALRIHDELRSIAAERHHLLAREAALLVRAEDIRLWRHFGCATFFEYLERYCDLHPRTAREHLRVARALTLLPAMRGELDAKRIPYSTARELTRIATPETEREWLAHVADLTTREIEEAVASHKRGDRPDDPTDPDRMVKLVLEVRASTYAQYIERRTHYADERGERLTDDEVLSSLCRPDNSPSAGKEPPYQTAITTAGRARNIFKSQAVAKSKCLPRSPSELAATRVISVTSNRRSCRARRRRCHPACAVRCWLAIGSRAWCPAVDHSDTSTCTTSSSSRRADHENRRT